MILGTIIRNKADVKAVITKTNTYASEGILMSRLQEYKVFTFYYSTEDGRPYAGHDTGTPDTYDGNNCCLVSSPDNYKLKQINGSKIYLGGE